MYLCTDLLFHCVFIRSLQDKLTYEIVAEDLRSLTSGASSYFYIDSETGELTLMRSLEGTGLNEIEVGPFPRGYLVRLMVFFIKERIHFNFAQLLAFCILLW